MGPNTHVRSYVDHVVAGSNKQSRSAQIGITLDQVMTKQSRVVTCLNAQAYPLRQPFDNVGYGASQHSPTPQFAMSSPHSKRVHREDFATATNTSNMNLSAKVFLLIGGIGSGCLL
jgi:hypothetical protein